MFCIIEINKGDNMFKKILMVSLMFFLLGACTQEVEEPEPEPIVEPEPEINVFDGSETDDQTYGAVAVMIGNTSHARPQSGLSMADVVYEISVETMTITRYLAIFEGEFPDKVGPIRSIRLPFVAMLDEWDVGIAHFGGASKGKGDAMSVLEDMYLPIRYDGVMDINTDYFWRDSTRIAPHNAYMDLNEASKDLPEMWPLKHFDFVESYDYVGDDATSVDINYTASIRNGYEYDETLNRYMKSLNDEECFDEFNDEPVLVTNIVVQHAEHSMVESDQYVLVNFYYSGDAEFFIGGKHIEGKWVKDHKDDTTHFFDLEGNPIQFLNGNTWIHIVHDKVKIKYE